MDSISKKALKVNNNLYSNLILRPAEDAPRIVLKSLDEWRALFVIIELLALRKYKTDERGFIKTTFKEIHKLFLSGRGGITTDKTVKAFESLAALRFDLIFKENQNTRREKTDSRLIDFTGDLKTITDLQINEIFFHNVYGCYVRVPSNIIDLLLESGKKLKKKTQLTPSDILLSLYALQVKNHVKDRPVVCKSIKELAIMLGLSNCMDRRQNGRARTAIEQSANKLMNIGFLYGFNFYNDSVYLTFKERKNAHLSGRNLSVARVKGQELNLRQGL